MRRKFFAAVLSVLLLLFAVRAGADFGGFSGRRSSSSHTRHNTSHTHNDSHSDIEGKFTVAFLAIGVSLLGIIAGEIIILSVDAILRHRRISKYCAGNPGFDEKDITSYAEELYCVMQSAWQNKDITPLKDKMTDEFFRRMDDRLKPFRETRQTDHTEGIEIKFSNIDDIKQKDGTDYFMLRLGTNIISYITDDETGRIISGSKRFKIKMVYEIKFMRKSGIIFSGKNNLALIVCDMTGEKV